MTHSTPLFADDPDLFAAFADILPSLPSPMHAPVAVGLQAWGAAVLRADASLHARVAVRRWALSLPPPVVDAAVRETLDVGAIQPDAVNLPALDRACLLYRLERSRRRLPADLGAAYAELRAIVDP